MSVNLVSLVSEFLTPNLISRIGAALGLDRILVGRAAVALGPAILGSLSHAASTSEGARKLANTVSQQSPSILDTLASMIGGAGQQTLVKDGINALGTLLGGSAVSALAGAVGRLTGIPQGPGSSLIGILDSSRAWPAWRAASSARPRCVRFGTASGCAERQYCRSFTIRIWGNASRIRGTGVRNC